MKTKDYVLCALFAAIISISAVLIIPLPFTPVPITLQVMTVFVTGAVLGAKRGLIAVFIYLLLGTVGIPIFAGMSSGPGILFGATGGFLIGFLPAVFLIGFLSERIILPRDGIVKKYWKLGIIMTFGAIVVYAFGTIQLMFFTRMDLWGALMSAVIPFLPLDGVKIILGVFLAYYLRQNNNWYKTVQS